MSKCMLESHDRVGSVSGARPFDQYPCSLGPKVLCCIRENCKVLTSDSQLRYQRLERPWTTFEMLTLIEDTQSRKWVSTCMFRSPGDYKKEEGERRNGSWGRIPRFWFLSDWYLTYNRPSYPGFLTMIDHRLLHIWCFLEAEEIISWLANKADHVPYCLVHNCPIRISCPDVSIPSMLTPNDRPAFIFHS